MDPRPSASLQAQTENLLGKPQLCPLRGSCGEGQPRAVAWNPAHTAANLFAANFLAEQSLAWEAFCDEAMSSERLSSLLRIVPLEPAPPHQGAGISALLPITASLCFPEKTEQAHSTRPWRPGTPSTCGKRPISTPGPRSRLRGEKLGGSLIGNGCSRERITWPPSARTSMTSCR